jgi:hypothetical protein
MPLKDDRDLEHGSGAASGAPAERTFIHRILRYVPSLLRDEWVNIGVLLYDPHTGERRLRLIEEEVEFNHVRRLHPNLDEESLRSLRDHLESRFGPAMQTNANGGPIRSTLRNGQGNPKADTTEWFSVLEKWDATLSQSLQLAEPKGTNAEDIDSEMDRLYNERVAVPTISSPRIQTAELRTRPQMRNYMDQVFRQAGLWGLIQKYVPVSQFTRDGDPMLIDYSYVQSETKRRGFIQTISLTNKPEDVRILALVAKTIQDTSERPQQDLSPEFTAVTDIRFESGKADHRFLDQTLGKVGITPIPIDNFAVWAARLRPMLQ